MAMKLASLSVRTPLAVSALAAVLLTACSWTWNVGAANPVPNVLMPRSPARMALFFGPLVDDAFRLPQANPSLTVNVTGWRETLTRGFRNSIGHFFVAARADQPGEPDLRLVVRLAVPFVPEQAHRVHVRFQAELLDRSGRSIKQWADTVPARLRFTADAYDMQRALATAVESMYELISKDFPIPGVGRG
jgi:hypothetical protein